MASLFKNLILFLLHSKDKRINEMVLTEQSFLEQEAVLGHFLLRLDGRNIAVLELLLELRDLVITQTHGLRTTSQIR